MSESVSELASQSVSESVSHSYALCLRTEMLEYRLALGDLHILILKGRAVELQNDDIHNSDKSNIV